MLARINSSVISGIDALPVFVEVDISFGLPAFNLVGLPETSVRESRDRVRTAIRNSGFSFPMDRITVNLAPADIKKEGTGFDLPVAMGILAASEVLDPSLCEDYAMVGELSLDGGVKPVPGVVAAALSARVQGLKGILVPQANAAEASAVPDLAVLPLDTLEKGVRFFSGFSHIDPIACRLDDLLTSEADWAGPDFQEVSGQESVKRALEVAAAGQHNVMMSGPPGSGKSMMAKCLAGILPPLTFEEAMDTTRIYSVAGRLDPEHPFVTHRPFRSPHHTITTAGLIGGGQRPKPGEVSLAHNGLLFLDELPEFKRPVLEVLRQPMEDGVVTLSRAGIRLSYPAAFMLVSAMNPCPCGYTGHPRRECTCTLTQIQRYRSKISGPLLDRIDIHLEVPAVPFTDLAKGGTGDRSEQIRERVARARQIQVRRFSDEGIHCNAQMQSRHIHRFCRVGSDGRVLLEKAVDRLGLSARAYGRILKVARTIADLENSEQMTPGHIAEAIQYRSVDRQER